MTSLRERVHQWYWGEQDRRENRRRAGIVEHLGIGPYDTTLPGPEVVWGIDIAGVYDGVPDYAVARKNGCRFVVVKIADGTLRGKLADENVAAARAAGLVVLGYCWLYRTARISAASQAQAWYSIATQLGLQFVVCDFEWTYWNGQQDNPTYSDLRAVEDAFERLAEGTPVQIVEDELWRYSAPGYLMSYPIQETTHRLWLANYKVPAPPAVAPYGPGGHTLWQCSETWPGDQLGVDPSWSHAIDGDIFNGTLEQFNALFSTVEPPEGGSVSKIIQGTALGSVKIRLGAQGVETGKYLVAGDKIEATENSAQWLHLSKINGVDVSANNWWASAGATQQYIAWQWVEVNGPPPPPPSGTPKVTGATIRFDDGSTQELVPSP